MTALIFPNDPLHSYVRKGELKIRYFNPRNIFSQIIFVDFSADRVDPEAISLITGEATVTIINLSPLTIMDTFMPTFRLHALFEQLQSIDFDVVRGYSASFSGFFSMHAARFKKVPSVISLHTNFNDMRYQFLKRRDFGRWIKYQIIKRVFEKPTLHGVDQIIAAYRFTKKYAVDMGVAEEKVEVIYNKVFFDKFFPREPMRDEKDIKIISVGNLEIGKGQRILVDAMAQLPENIHLTLVGDGEDYDLLQEKVRQYHLERRVDFIRSIPNLELARLYREYDIFSLPIQYGGVCIPALEATASGLALVMPKPIHEEQPEITGEYAEVVENSPAGFVEGIAKLAQSAELRKTMREKGLATIKNYSGDIMEEKEARLYLKMLK